MESVLTIWGRKNKWYYKSWGLAGKYGNRQEKKCFIEIWIVPWQSGQEKQTVQENLGIGRKIWQVTGKDRFHRNMESVLPYEVVKIDGKAKFGGWQEHIASDRKSRFQRNMDRVLTIQGRKRNGTQTFGDWQENMASDRKRKISSNMDSVLLYEAGKIYGTAKFGHWQESMASDRKSKVSSKYGKCLDNTELEKQKV